MKKAIKIILPTFGVIFVGFVILFFLSKRGVVSVNVIPDARTLYTGYVKIVPIPLTEIKTRLEAQGCYDTGFNGETTNPCRYHDTAASYENKNAILVHPHGFGWGPMSFSLTDDKLWSTKDIPGPPDEEKFKKEVRQDVSAIGNIVQIKEDTWKITETKYPWTVIY